VPRIAKFYWVLFKKFSAIRRRCAVEVGLGQGLFPVIMQKLRHAVCVNLFISVSVYSWVFGLSCFNTVLNRLSEWLVCTVRTEWYVFHRSQSCWTLITRCHYSASLMEASFNCISKRLSCVWISLCAFHTVFELPEVGGWIPNCFLNRLAHCQIVFWRDQLYTICRIYIAILVGLQVKKFNPPANFSQFKHCTHTCSIDAWTRPDLMVTNLDIV